MGIEIDVKNNQILWRYMDLSKLLSLLVNESLAFPRVDLFDDPYEGYAKNYLELAKKSYMDNPFMVNPHDVFVETGLIHNLIKILNFNSYVSCWHMNDCESAAMWKLYCNSSDSIVIKTTVRKLILSLNEHLNDLDYGGVRYDFTFEELKKLDVISIADPLFTKRKSFEHEKEFRVIYRNYESYVSNRKIMENEHKNYVSKSDFSVLTDEVKASLELGHYYDLESGQELSEKFITEIMQQSKSVVNLSLDPTILIEEIIISPDSPDWFVETVKSTLKLLNYDFPIRKSDLNNLI